MAETTGGFAPDDPTPRKTKRDKASGWREEGTGWNRPVLIALTLILLLGLAGAILALIIRPDPPTDPLVVTLPLGEYPPPWLAPPTVYRDANLVADSFPITGGRPAPRETFAQQQKDRLDGILAWFEGTGQAIDGGPDDLSQRPLVVWITGLAQVRGAEVDLLPADARPEDPASWIPLARILDAVTACRAPNKWLVLDLATPQADAFGGTLRDDVTQVLHDQLTARTQSAAGLPFVVTTSTGPQEWNQFVPSHRCTAFAYYVAQGLRGAADGYDGNSQTTNRDNTIQVGELTRFVKPRVERFARIVYGRPQSPTTYGLTERTDFRLSSTLTGALPDPEPLPMYPADLKAGWADRAVARGRNGHRLLPAEFARLTESLLRAEAVWAGSGDAERTQKTWAGARQDWENRVRDLGPTDPVADVITKARGRVADHRLVVELSAKSAPAEAYVPLREALRKASLAVEAIPPAPRDKARPEAETKAWEMAVPDPDTRTRMLWEVIAETPTPSFETLKYWRAEWSGPLVTDKRRATSEAVLLATLAERDIANELLLPTHPRLGVGALVRVEQAVSSLLAQGPLGFDLIATRVSLAESMRKTGQTDLFAGPRAKTEQAHVALLAAAQQLDECRLHLARWQEATALMNEAIPLILESLPGELVGTADEFDRWLVLVQHTSRLQDILSAARTARTFEAKQIPEEQLVELRRLVVAMRGSWIQPKDDEQPRDNLGPARTKPTDWQPLDRLLAGAVISPNRRQGVWDVGQTDRDKLLQEVFEADAADTANRQATRNVLSAKLGDRPDETQLAVRRAQASLALLDLAGHPDLAQVKVLRDQVVQTSATPNVARTLGEKLRTIWVQGVPSSARARSIVPLGLARHRSPRATAESLPGQLEAEADTQAFLAYARMVLLNDRDHRSRSEPGKTFYTTTLRSLSAP